MEKLFRSKDNDTILLHWTSMGVYSADKIYITDCCSTITFHLGNALRKLSIPNPSNTGCKGRMAQKMTGPSRGDLR